MTYISNLFRRLQCFDFSGSKVSKNTPNALSSLFSLSIPLECAIGVSSITSTIHTNIRPTLSVDLGAGTGNISSSIVLTFRRPNVTGCRQSKYLGRLKGITSGAPCPKLVGYTTGRLVLGALSGKFLEFSVRTICQ